MKHIRQHIRSLILTLIGSCFGSLTFGQQKLSLKLPEKDTKLSEVSIETSISHPDNTDRKTTREKSGCVLVIDHKKQTEAGTNATFHYDALNYEKYLKNKKGGDSIIVSSTKNGGQFFANIMKNATNVPFSANFDKKGRIISMSGIDTLSKNVFKTVMRKTDIRAEKIFKHRITVLYGERYVKSILETLCATLPDSTVKEDGYWTQETHNLCGLNAQIRTQYQLVKINKDTYTIKGTSTISDAETGTFYCENGIGQSLSETEGTAKLSLEVDINTGIVTIGTIEMQFTANASSLNLNETKSGAPARKIAVTSKVAIAPAQ